MANYFDVLTSIVNKKKMTEEDINKYFDSFMTTKYLSGQIQSAYQANKINCLPLLNKIPKKVQYELFKNTITIKKNTRIPFSKKDKDEEVILKAIAKYYNVNKERAKEYKKMIGNKETIKILTFMSYSGNDYINDPFVLEIRKVLKKINKIK